MQISHLNDKLLDVVFAGFRLDAAQLRLILLHVAISCLVRLNCEIGEASTKVLRLLLYATTQFHHDRVLLALLLHRRVDAIHVLLELAVVTVFVA